MRASRKLCGICWQDGHERKAVGYYFAQRIEEGTKELWDICKKHAKIVEKQGLTLFYFTKKDEVKVYDY